jgi:phosphotransferase system  glucose/maltose/N-acetylglucosamine-specific IIC component
MSSSSENSGLEYLSQTLTQEYYNTYLEIKKLKDSIAFYQNVIFLLFFIIIIIISLSIYYIHTVNAINIVLIQEQVTYEVKKELFNKNIDLIIDFLNQHRL